MKHVYHIHQSSDSYWSHVWYDTDYYLCDTEEEYNELLAKYVAKRQQIMADYASSKIPTASQEWQFKNFKLYEEEQIKASEYYYGHEWQGQNFDAFGFGWYERLERSSHTKYFLKPNSIKNHSYCTDMVCNGYGS